MDPGWLKVVAAKNPDRRQEQGWPLCPGQEPWAWVGLGLEAERPRPLLPQGRPPEGCLPQQRPKEDTEGGGGWGNGQQSGKGAAPHRGAAPSWHIHPGDSEPTVPQTAKQSYGFPVFYPRGLRTCSHKNSHRKAHGITAHHS